MSKKQAISVINAAFTHIDGPQDGFMTVRDILYDMCLLAERGHRRFMGGRKCGLTVSQAAKLFTIQYIAKGLEHPDRWSIDDVIRVRLECLKAQAYAKKYRFEFEAAFAAAGVTVADILALDYVDLMQ